MIDNEKSINLIVLLKAVIGLAQNKADDIIGYYYMVDPFTKEKSNHLSTKRTMALIKPAMLGR